MLNISVTADHEVFFRENFKNEKEVVIEATYTLMNLLRKYDASLTLMTDVCSIWRYRELGLNEYPDFMEEQLKLAVRNGHDVQLHLHPHWLTSLYVDKKWRFDYTKTRLHDMGFEKEGATGSTADKLIRDGKEYLENLLKYEDSGYKCVAFRAGGWSIQPEKYFLKALKDAGILIDTTVFKGGYSKSNTYYYDFLHVPDRINWWIDPEKGLYDENKCDPNKYMFEVAIGSYDQKPHVWIIKLKNKLFIPKYYEKPRGAGINVKQYSRPRRFWDQVYKFITEPIVFSFDTNSNFFLFTVIDYYLNKFDCINHDYFVSLICHPKALGDSHFKNIEQFLGTIRTRYPYVKLINLRSVYKKLECAK